MLIQWVFMGYFPCAEGPARDQTSYLLWEEGSAEDAHLFSADEDEVKKRLVICLRPQNQGHHCHLQHQIFLVCARHHGKCSSQSPGPECPCPAPLHCPGLSQTLMPGPWFPAWSLWPEIDSLLPAGPAVGSLVVAWVLEKAKNLTSFPGPSSSHLLL
jgi:hypothetical protein